MVLEDSAALDDVFHALADPTRRAMLRSLASAPQNIGELAAPFSMSFAAASKHIRVLESAGLVSRSIEGRSHLCQIESSALAPAHEWLGNFERFWDERLDALDEVLKAEALTGARTLAKHSPGTRSHNKKGRRQ